MRTPHLFVQRALPAIFAVVALAAPAAACEMGELNALLQAGRFDSALGKASSCLERNPGDAQLRIMKGISLTGLGRQQEAIDLFTGMTKDFPRLAEPYNNLAVLHAGAGDYDRARAALEKAIEADPAYTTAYENLADLHAQLARKAYARVIELSPDNANARKWHALLDKTRGEPEAAQPAPAAEVATTGKTIDRTELVLSTVRSWAQAWSARDVAAYLGYYAPEFVTPGAQPRQTWEARRNALITGKARIQVEVRTPKVRFDGERATVRFMQKYASDTYSESVYKTLMLRAYDDGWKIVEERAGR